MSHSGTMGGRATVAGQARPVNTSKDLEVRMERLLTLKAAAQKLAVSQQFLKRLQRQGRLKVVRLGRSVRIEERELERLVRDGSGK